MKLLPRDKKPLYVMPNIHTSKEKRVHHSCFYIGDGSYFFYSYGLFPIKEVTAFSVLLKFKKMAQNTKCSQMSLYVLRRLHQGDKFTDIILSLYKNELKNIS